MDSRYNRHNRRKYSLKVHIVLVTKYRKQLLKDYIADDVKQKIFDIANTRGYEIIAIETDKDHIHFLIKSEPKVSVLSIVRKLKQESTNRLWKTQKEYLKKYYWGENTLWSDGNFASTIGNVSKEAAEYYIRNQG